MRSAAVAKPSRSMPKGLALSQLI